MALSKITNASVADTAVYGRRNLIINGAMEVAQRGSSATKTSNGYGGYLSADRWAAYYNKTTLATQTPVRLNGNLLTPLRVSHSGSSNQNLYVYQNIEDGMKRYAGQTLTVSLYARGSSDMTISGSNNVRAVAAGNASTDPNVGNFTSINITTSWQRYTRTITLNSSYTSGRDHLMILFSSSNQPSSEWMEITGVQVELGDTATPFEHRSYGEELALCQRYYHKPDSMTLYVSGWGANKYIRTDQEPPVTMRATPTITYNSGTGGSATADNFNPSASTNRYGFYCRPTYLGGSTGRVYISAITLDAEL